MTQQRHPIFQLIEDDPRYKIDAYQFVREALAFAQEVLDMGAERASEPGEDEPDPEPDSEQRPERHLTGQQLCEAIRRYALQQYGLMAKVVLADWGIHATGDFGEIVYNLIGIGEMKKSADDRREDFDDVYDFADAFSQPFSTSNDEG